MLNIQEIIELFGLNIIIKFLFLLQVIKKELKFNYLKEIVFLNGGLK